MTFAEVLPALTAGRKATRAPWKTSPCVVTSFTEGKLVFSDSTDWRYIEATDLLASDWELVEEPGAVDGCDGIDGPEGRRHRHCSRCLTSGATIARLERERDLLKLTVKTCEEVSAALERELAEAKRKAAKFDTMERLLKQGGWEVK